MRISASGEAPLPIVRGGRMSLQQLLRCRARYFTDGFVVGSRQFVESFFEEQRSLFGPNRKNGARRMRGGDWGDLASIRDLRERVLGPPGSGD